MLNFCDNVMNIYSEYKGVKFFMLFRQTKPDDELFFQ